MLPSKGVARPYSVKVLVSARLGFGYARLTVKSGLEPTTLALKQAGLVELAAKHGEYAPTTAPQRKTVAPRSRGGRREEQTGPRESEMYFREAVRDGKVPEKHRELPWATQYAGAMLFKGARGAG